MAPSYAALFLFVRSTTALSQGDKLRDNWAPGVNLPPLQRNPPQRWVWAYTGAVTQGEAEDIYNAAGQPTVEDVLNTAVNQLSFIANVNVNQSTNWWAPGANNTAGCGQLQTFELPFGYNAINKSMEQQSLPIFHSNLKKIHESGVTITLTLGSWCTQLPVHSKQEWSDAEFNNFVAYFKQVRTTFSVATLMASTLIGKGIAMLVVSRVLASALGTIRFVARRHQMSLPQVSLGWHLQ